VKRLKNELRDALDKVRAGDELKRRTSAFLRSEIARRGRGGARFRPRFAAVCAVFVLFMLIGGFSVYLTPAAHIDFDVNPSVGFAVNRFGIVIDAAAYNDGGAKILRSVGVKNKSYGEASKILIGAFISEGYLSDDGLVSATVQASDKDYENDLLAALADVVNLSLSDHRISAETDLFSVDAEVMSAAHGHHMTPAKYLAVEELLEVDPTATFESGAESGVKEIRARIRACGGGGHSGAGSGQSYNSGQPGGSRRRQNGRHHSMDDGHGRD
jgi:hypothetical protein